MIANTPGSCLTEQVGQEAVPPAKVATFTERKKTGDMLGELVEDRANVVVEPSKNNREMNRRNGETAKRALY
jgi:hypothetical protein